MFLEKLKGFDLTIKIVISMLGDGITSQARDCLQPNLFPKLLVETTTSPWVCHVDEDYRIQVSASGNELEIKGTVLSSTHDTEIIAQLFRQKLNCKHCVSPSLLRSLTAMTKQFHDFG